MELSKLQLAVKRHETIVGNKGRLIFFKKIDKELAKKLWEDKVKVYVSPSDLNKPVPLQSEFPMEIQEIDRWVWDYNGSSFDFYVGDNYYTVIVPIRKADNSIAYRHYYIIVWDSYSAEEITLYVCNKYGKGATWREISKEEKYNHKISIKQHRPNCFL